MHRVSVVILVYNTEKYLEQCVSSVLNQTLTDLEIICVDDGSTDASPEILRRLASEHPCLRVISQNQGVSAARNRGLDEADGRYIYFLDSDDWILPETLSRLTEKAEREELQMLFFDGASFRDGPDGQMEYLPESQYRRKRTYSACTGLEMLSAMTSWQEYRVSVVMTLYRHDFLLEEGIRFYEQIIHEDNLFTFTCVLKARRCGHLGEALYQRRVTPNSIMTSPTSARHYLGYATCLGEMLRLLEGRSFSGADELAIRRVLSEITIALQRAGEKLTDAEWLKVESDRSLPRRLLCNLTSQGMIPRCSLGDLIIPRAEIDVSVIIPTHNSAPFLCECLDSVLAQSMPNLEVICADDGSDDGLTRELLASYARRDARVQVLLREKTTPGETRNAAMEAARGRYLLFVDSDDFIEPDMVLACYSRAMETQSDLVLCGMDAYDHITHLLSPLPNSLVRLPIMRHKGVFSRRDLGEKLYLCNYPGVHCKLVRRAFAQEKHLQFAASPITEDVHFTLPLMALAERISLVRTETPLYHYRINRAGSMESVKNKYLLGFYRSHAEAVAFMEQSGVMDEVREALRLRLILSFAYEVQTQRSYEDYVQTLSFLQREGLALCQAGDVPEEAMTTPQLKKAYAVLHSPVMTRETYDALHPAPRYPLRIPGQAPDHPVVSVILPTYNVQRYLWDAVESLQRQTMDNFEIIFVDDGSTDLSARMVELLAGSDPRIRLIRQENRYAGVARNTGMAQARGKYLLFMDPDDFADPEMLEKACGRAEETHADICMFKAQRYDQRQRCVSPIPWIYHAGRYPADKPVFSAEDIPDTILNFCTSSPWNKLCRRDFVTEQRLLFQDTRSANDYYFVRMASVTARRITLLPDCLYNYRTNVPTSLQATQNKDPLSFFRAAVRLRDEMDARGLLTRYRRSFDNSVAELCSYSLKTLSGEALHTTYDFLHTKGLADLGATEHEAAYYFTKTAYEDLCCLLRGDFAQYVSAHRASCAISGQEERVPVLYTRPARPVPPAPPTPPAPPAPPTPPAPVKKREESDKAREIIKRQDMALAYQQGVLACQMTLSYKLGCALTWLPRQIRACGRSLRTSGVRATVKRAGVKLRRLPATVRNRLGA